MAVKYGSRKRHNAGTIRKSTSTRGGSRTRSTTTTKRGNYTYSRSVNRDGTVRQTKTHKSPAGFITRTVSTIGSKPKKPKTPKFITAKPYKPPKIRINKSTVGSYRTSTRRSRGSSRSYSGGSGGGGELIVLLFFGIFVFMWWIAKNLTVAIWGAAKYSIKQENHNWWYWTKVIFMFLVFYYLFVLLFYHLFNFLIYLYDFNTPQPLQSL